MNKELISEDVVQSFNPFNPSLWYETTTRVYKVANDDGEESFDVEMTSVSIDAPPNPLRINNGQEN